MVAIFCEEMLRKITPTIYGDGRKTRDYVELWEVARANFQALKLGEGEIFNIASGARTTHYAIFTHAREALGVAPFSPIFALKRPGEGNPIIREYFSDYCAAGADGLALFLTC